MSSEQNRKKVTIREIAKACNVSSAAVSLALRNQSGIPEHTRTRIKEAAEKLGYRPNPMVATLMAQIRTGKISGDTPSVLAFLNPWPVPAKEQSYYMKTILKGMHQRAGELGYTIKEFSLADKDLSMKRLQKILHTRNIRGLIIPPLPRPYGHIPLDFSSFASVVVGGYTLRRPDLHRVMPDHFENMNLLIRKIRRRGYTRLGMVMVNDFEKRVNHAWSAALASSQIIRNKASDRIPTLYVENLDIDAPLLRWYEKYKPEVVIGWSPEIISRLKQHGVSIPGDCAYAQITNAELDDHIAGINEDAFEIGVAGVQVIVGQINRNEWGIPNKQLLVHVPGIWSEGSSLPRRSAPIPE